MKTTLLKAGLSTAIIVITLFITNCSGPEKKAEVETLSSDAGKLMDVQPDVDRGRYLVTVGVCDDCHSPKIMTPQGPVIDSTRRLSGHPADAPGPKYTAADLKPGNNIMGAPDLTSWAGPWGVSFTYNLTPDKETGTGSWNDELFIRIIRSGKHMGAEASRPILPPMPWQNFAQMTDDDLRAIFAFLQTLPPIKNKVPDPVPPPGN